MLPCVYPTGAKNKGDYLSAPSGRNPSTRRTDHDLFKEGGAE